MKLEEFKTKVLELEKQQKAVLELLTQMHIDLYAHLDLEADTESVGGDEEPC